MKTSVICKQNMRTILIFISICSFMLFSCKEPDLPNNNSGDNNQTFACELDSLIRSGNFQEDGSYKWHINFKIINNFATSEEVILTLRNESSSPFIIDSNNKLLSIKPLSFDYQSLSITVPSSIANSNDFSKSYTYTLSILKNGEELSSKSFVVGTPLPNHPRLFVREGELAELKLRFNHADFNMVRTSFANQKAFQTTGVITQDKPNEAIRQKMEALAFEYLIDRNNKVNSGREAIQIAINYLSSFGSISSQSVTDYDDLQYTNDMIIGAAMVYDWCYPLMTFSEKRKMIDAMVAVLKRTEYGLPGSSGSKAQRYLSGHYSEVQPTTYLAMGIAIYDEDPSYFEFAYNEQVNSFAISRNPMFNAQTHHQGAQYIHVRHSNELLQHFLLKKLNLSPYNNTINTLTYRVLYGTIPQKTDMDGMPEGDSHNRLVMKNPYLYYLSANLSGDSYLQYLAKKNLSLALNQSTRLFIYHNPQIQAIRPDDGLPLSKFFPSPAGLMIARTKWDIDAQGYSSNAMVVLMNMKEYNAQNHTHLDGGHFSIYYKAHLALDAGIYQGSDPNNEWGAPNYNNYYSRTIAHNTVTILDPNEPLPYVAHNVQASARDGGQFFFSPRPWYTSAEMFNAGKSTEILAHAIEPTAVPEYSYLKGDLTRAYNVPSYMMYPPKVDTVRRSFVFLNHNENVVPGTLIVFDKIVSTNANFKKTWLLHTQNQPTHNGDIITATSTASGRNGKLVNTMILPEAADRNVEFIGGSGKEYWVDGRNWGTVTQEDAGKWRVEISPVAPNKANNFLNVIQVTDAGNSTGLNDISSISSTTNNYVAVRVKDRIVAQYKLLGTNDKSVSFTLGNTNRTYKILITDLQSGAWKITLPGGNTINRTVNAEAGILYFESSGGLIQISKM